jgi:serine/threonine protein kinase
MSQFEIIFESPASTIYRTTRDLGNRDGTTSTRMLAVKTGSSSSEYTPEPHDIVKEARILTRLVHPNVSTHRRLLLSPCRAELGEIIDIVHAGHDSQRPDLFSIWLPFVEYTLQDLLDSPLFAPSSPSWIPSLSLGNVSVEDFNIVLESMVLQMLSATVFLHDTANSVAHRDIKPGNFLVTPAGCVKLIDFGVAYELSPKSEESNLDLWPEAPSSLYTQVSTGLVIWFRDLPCAC